MKKGNCKQPEKCNLITGEDEKKNQIKTTVISVIIAVLIVTCIILLLLHNLKNNYFSRHAFPKDNTIVKNIKKKGYNNLSTQEARIYSRKVHSKDKKAGHDICLKTLKLHHNSAAIPKPLFCGGSVYFIKGDDSLTDQEACALESVLHMYPSNITHLVELLCNRPKELVLGVDFIDLLGESYKNLIHSSIEGKTFFNNTPVQGHWKCDNNIALFEAKLLTLWLYGGAIMSFDVLLNIPQVLTCDDQYFSQDVMVNKKICDGFIYMLMKQFNPSKDIPIADVLKKEINNYKKTYANSGIKYIDNATICNHFSLNCAFLVAEDLKKTTGTWSANFAQFCPIIMNQFQNKPEQ